MECKNHQLFQNTESKNNTLYRRVLFLSVIINLCFCIGTGFYAYSKREKTESILTSTRSEPTKEILAEFNNRPLNLFQDSICIGASKSLSFMFLGNSITRHGITDFWDHECGMAASIQEKDYVHQFINKVAKEKNVNIKYSVCNITDFERCFVTSDFDWNVILSKSEIKEPDYVIVQIGENMKNDDIEHHEQTLRSKYTELLRHFTNSTRIITLPYWFSSKKNYIFTDIAITTHSHIVDLSHLGTDSDENSASSEKEYNHPGVGDHPGDRGMERIAEMLFSVVNSN